MRFFWQKKPQHTFDYLILIAILATTALIVRIFSLTDIALAILTFVLSLGYIAWGVAHHHKSGHIDRKIFFEYFGLAILVNVLVLILII